MEGSIQQNQESAEGLLYRFLREEDCGARECLEKLLTEHAEPVIRRVVRKQGYSVEDEEDVRGHAILQVIERLRALRTSSAGSPLDDFCSYVAAIASNSCNRLLRVRYPMRWSLKNRVRYLLIHRPDFFLRGDLHEGWVCGLTTWKRDVLSQQPLPGPQQERFLHHRDVSCGASESRSPEAGIQERQLTQSSWLGHVSYFSYDFLDDCHSFASSDQAPALAMSRKISPKKDRKIGSRFVQHAKRFIVFVPRRQPFPRRPLGHT